MFNAWKQEKAITALVEEAQALAEKLGAAKPHIRDSHAAHARFWELSYLAEGQILNDVANWPHAAVTRFISGAQSKITALRKKRHYDSSDGLTVWLHTARAVTEPRIAPGVQDIWQQILAAGPNTDTMVTDLLAEAGLSGDPARQVPFGFDQRADPF